MCEGPFFLDVPDFCDQQLACVHESGKDDVVFLGDVSELLFLVVEDQDGILVEFVILPPEGQAVSAAASGKEEGG